MTRPAAALGLGAALLAVGCGGTVAGAGSGSPDAPAAEETVGGTATVFAAASLTDVFTELGELYAAEHPGAGLRFNFAGSSALAGQIVQGAPADVFASANEQQMDVVTGAGLAAEPRPFATNLLQIAVPAGNPAGITGPADFAREELTLAVCAPEVPCGTAGEQVFAAAGVDVVPDTLEQDVRAALTKVELGEVDAALVYATDVAAAGDAVEGIAFPEADDAVNVYPLAVLDEAPNPEAAGAFVDLVLSERGQQALAAAGFGRP